MKNTCTEAELRCAAAFTASRPRYWIEATMINQHSSWVTSGCHPGARPRIGPQANLQVTRISVSVDLLDFRLPLCQEAP